MTIVDNERRIAALEAAVQFRSLCDERYARIMDAVDQLRKETENLRREATNYRRQRMIQTVGILAAALTGVTLLALRIMSKV